MSLVVMFCFCFCFVVTPEWFTTVGNWSNKNKRVLTFIQYRDGMNAWKMGPYIYTVSNKQPSFTLNALLDPSVDTFPNLQLGVTNLTDATNPQV